MIEADALEIVGLLFGSYAGGWIPGYLMLSFKQAVDKI
jgi:hypothetical protein